MKWQIGIFIGLFITTSAPAAVVSTEYVDQYFKNMCNNPNLTVPSGGSGIASVRYVMSVVDYLNSNKTNFASNLTSDGMASDTYMSGVDGHLGESETCCLGGVINSSGACTSCGVWLVESTKGCLRAGEYMVSGGACAPCPAGYECPAGQSSVNMASFACDNTLTFIE